MTVPTNPTWYDVLGVSRRASAEEIKAAWRHATDRFEPGQGSGQFRMFNEAADVLLDPARRREYDDSLDAGGAPQTPAGPVETGVGASTGPAESNAFEKADEKPAETTAGAATRRRERERRRATRAQVATPASGRLKVATAVLAVLTLVAIGLAVWFTVQVRRAAAVDDARSAAPASAERAAKAMLAYDYRHLSADRNRAAAFLTPSYKKKYLQTFSLLEKNKDGTPGAALQTKTVVTASVEGSGVVDAESDKVRVLVFVNQVSRKAGGEPQIFQNRVAMTMTKHGNRWLVNDLKSY